MRSLPLFGLLLLLIPGGVSGQSAFDQDIPIKDLSIRNWSADDGLSSNNTTSVFQGSDGLLWITSFNGFMTFDSEQIDIWDRSKLSFLNTDGFYSVVENKDGRIFIGSQGSGLILYDAGEYSIYNSTFGEIPKSIRSLLFTGNGDLLIGTTNSGLYRLHKDSLFHINNPELDKAPITALIEDRNGTVWCGTDGQGVFKLSDNKSMQYKVRDGLSSDNIGALILLPDNTLGIGTGKGLNKFDPTKSMFESITGIESVQINSLLLDGKSALWIGTEKWLGRYHLESQQLELLESRNGVDFVRITKIIKSKEGNLWATSNRSGLIQIRQTNIANFQGPVLGSDRVNIVHETPQGKLYVGTDVNQLDILENNTWRHLPIKTSIAGNGVRDIYEENPNSLWLATYSGIIHIHNGIETIYSTSNGMPANDFRTILKDSKGYFWFGSRSGGAVKFKDGKIQQIYLKNNGLESNYVMSITEAANGDIYVGTNSGGMTVIYTDGTTRTYHLRSDDAGILIFNVDQDNAGRIWVMANTGPALFDGDSLIAIPLQADPKSKTYFDWIDNGQGTMWITTNNGVLQIDKQVLLECLKQHKVVPVRLLNEIDGMSNKECTGATRSTRSATGKIYIPTLGGVCIINPAREQFNKVVPTVRISRFVTDTVEHNTLANELVIEPGRFRYSFRFSSISFTAPDRNQYRYQLVGLDKEWSDITTKGEVEYTNLSPGQYTFHVMGSNDNDIWNEKGASLTFVVKPYYYQTLWFYILCFTAFLGSIYGLYTWRITLAKKQNEALKKVNTELDRFVYSASHDLRSPLSSILGLINIARMDKEANPMDYFNLIDKSVRKLDSFIRDIIDFSRNARLEIEPNRVEFESLIKDIFEDVHFLENYSKFRQSVLIHTRKDFQSDSKRIRIILSNLISNAIKHHLERENVTPEVTIEIKDSGKGVNITVKDNGPGIEEKHLQNIFKMFFRATDRTPGSGLGLYIVEETVTKLKGTITVSSVIDQGTTFTVFLPNLHK